MTPKEHRVGSAVGSEWAHATTIWRCKELGHLHRMPAGLVVTEHVLFAARHVHSLLVCHEAFGRGR